MKANIPDSSELQQIAMETDFLSFPSALSHESIALGSHSNNDTSVVKATDWAERQKEHLHRC